MLWIDNLHSTKMDGDIDCVFSAKDILTLLQNPMCVKNIEERKKRVPLFNCGALVSDALRNKNNEIARTGHNVSFYNALILDYDNGKMPVDDFVNKYGEYEFYLYTSFRYTKELQKFRAIMPLLTLIKPQILLDNCEKLIDEFCIPDRASFKSLQFFYIPCYSDINNYFYISNPNNSHKRLDLSHLKEIDKKFLFSRYISKQKQLPNPVTPFMKRRRLYLLSKEDDLITKQLESIDLTKRGGGLVHEYFLKANARLQHVGWTKDEVATLLLKHVVGEEMKKEVGRMIERFGC